MFTDASRLKTGDSVRVAGIRVGTVENVSLQGDNNVLVNFDTDRNIKLTTGTKAAVRYLNLVGDRYMELVDGPGSTRMMPAGSQIPVDRTEPALDLDLLLGGLKPVIQGLNPQDVNALTSSLIQIFQGQGGTLESLLSNTSSFSYALADNNQLIEQLIDNLNTVAGHPVQGWRRLLGRDRHLENLITGSRRTAIRSARPSSLWTTAPRRSLICWPGAAPTERHGRPIEPARPNARPRQGPPRRHLQRLPEHYRKLARVGSYGGFIQYYICAVPSGSAIFRAGPRSSRGSSKRTEGAGKSRCLSTADPTSSEPASSASSWSILVIAVGLAARAASCRGRRRCDIRRCSPRRVVSPIGNDVTLSGIKVGSVSGIELDDGDALVGFTVNGSTR